jgi:hypothetical protein
LELAKDLAEAEQILASIADDYRYASRAEHDFIEWECRHRNDGGCEEFATRFFAWLEASEPYVAGQNMIEERYPELMDRLNIELKKVR